MQQGGGVLYNLWCGRDPLPLLQLEVPRENSTSALLAAPLVHHSLARLLLVRLATLP